MRKLQSVLLVIVAAVTLTAAQNRTDANKPGGTAPTTNTTVNPLPQTPSLRILTPVAGQVLSANFVDLRFELVKPDVSSSPNFLIQLDGSDPVHSTTTEYTFTGLQPGEHSVTVTLVDANDRPIEGRAATVQFKVPGAGPTGAGVQSGGSRLAAAAAGIPAELTHDGDPNQPMSGSPMPLLSLVGFGILIGGIASAMKTR